MQLMIKGYAEQLSIVCVSWRYENEQAMSVVQPWNLVQNPISARI